MRKGRWWVLITAALYSACNHDYGTIFVRRSDAGLRCKDGTQGCRCYGNDTCNRGLTCESGICVPGSPDGSLLEPEPRGGAGGRGGSSPALMSGGTTMHDTPFG